MSSSSNIGLSRLWSCPWRLLLVWHFFAATLVGYFQVIRRWWKLAANLSFRFWGFCCFCYWEIAFYVHCSLFRLFRKNRKRWLERVQHLCHSWQCILYCWHWRVPSMVPKNERLSYGSAFSSGGCPRQQLVSCDSLAGYLSAIFGWQ